MTHCHCSFFPDERVDIIRRREGNCSHPDSSHPHKSQRSFSGRGQGGGECACSSKRLQERNKARQGVNANSIGVAAFTFSLTCPFSVLQNHRQRPAIRWLALPLYAFCLGRAQEETSPTSSILANNIFNLIPHMMLHNI